MLRNARTEYQEEAWEIATYTVIDSVATAAGDKETAKLARDIMREEERMQSYLAALLPELSADLAHDEIPVSEIEGKAARRTAADSKPKRPLGVARLRPDVDAGVDREAVDLGELVGAEVEVVERAQRVVELGDARRADQRRGDRARRAAPMRSPSAPASARGPWRSR